MCKCLTPIAPNIFVENLANSLLLAAIFALILDTMDVIQITQTCSEVPYILRAYLSTHSGRRTASLAKIAFNFGYSAYTNGITPGFLKKTTISYIH
jgi:hypothetical protein